MTIQSDVAAAPTGLAIPQETELPSGDTAAAEYAGHGTGSGVLVIPTTVGHRRLLTLSRSGAVGAELWQFPRLLTSRDSAAEAERCLFAATGLQATCRRIGAVAPDPASLTTVYGVYEAFIEPPADGELPALPGAEGARWLDELEFALAHRAAGVADALTLSALTLQSIEEATSDY